MESITIDDKEDDVGFPSEIIDITRQDRIGELVSIQYNEILNKIDEMKENAHTGWRYAYGVKVFLKISAYQPLRGSSHFDLPKLWAKPQLGIKNKDNNCFHHCIYIYLRIIARLQNISTPNLNDVNRSKKYARMVNFTGINSPASLCDIDIFEENNLSFAVNVFYPARSENREQLQK